jgi:acyl transferase domain-containing protein
MISPTPSGQIAIIGAAGRFPDAADLRAFWRNLEAGLESLVTFTDEELRAQGVDSGTLSNPNFVKKGTLLEGADLFDASFFGINPREAEIMDPQHRLLLECAWEALEDAGYANGFESRTGVYAGTSVNGYLHGCLLRAPKLLTSVGAYQTMIGNDKDFLSTRVSYKLNLRGPSLTIQTACSTSLVAVETGYQALLRGECDMALAGGVSLRFPQRMGYTYSEGMIFSPDGHCRPFDEQGRGIRAGDGVGLILMKRLEHALRDGDHIRAVIRGAAINNDGAGKMGYTAPSVDGQAAAICTAIERAQINPETISYVEAHGTATPLGDPIEIAALTQAYRTYTSKKQYCAIGSLKSNLGHLDAAAGIGGLIKTLLALENRSIPPSLNFKNPNPQIDFASSPFFVAAHLSGWTSDGPRRAAVSSFGIGGTNAHVVLEEAPAPKASTVNWPAQLLLVSGRTPAALESQRQRLFNFLRDEPAVPFADACYTLQVGRKRFAHRGMLVAASAEEALAALDGIALGRWITRSEDAADRPVAFLFSGQGSQHALMARGLYEIQPTFRDAVDRCAEILKPLLSQDLREVFADSAAGPLLEQTRLAQPALFTIEYALARMWMEFGVQPDAMIGHSIGEYAAACIAGVFSLEDALRLVAARGRLMQEMPPGAMLAIPLAPEKITPQLPQGVTIAAINSPTLCAVAGPEEQIALFQGKLQMQGIEVRRIVTSHAFHSAMMDGVLPAFRDVLRSIQLHAPKIPFISNVTGTWIQPTDATNPEYWITHIRQVVRFAEGVQTLAATPGRLFLEVGPGQALTTIARDCINGRIGVEVIPSLPHARDIQAPAAHLLQTVGRLWLAGVAIDWTGAHRGESLHRVSLPTYPFERQRHWVEPEVDLPHFFLDEQKSLADKNPNLDEWFYLPSWRRTALPSILDEGRDFGPWLVIGDAQVCEPFVAELTRRDQQFSIATYANLYTSPDANTYTIHAENGNHYRALLESAAAQGLSPRTVVYLSSPGKGRDSFYGLIRLAQAFGNVGTVQRTQLLVISSGQCAVTGSETMDPDQALLRGPCAGIPLEYFDLSTRGIDIDNWDRLRDVVPELLLEPAVPGATSVIAYRNGHRWEQTYVPTRISARTHVPKLREGGVYWITGGTGGIGLAIASHLAEAYHARVAITGRTPLPARETWARWIAERPPEDPVRRTIDAMQTLERFGAEVLYCAADSADRPAMEAAVNLIHQRFGSINGVIHAAGIADRELIRTLSVEVAERVLKSKVEGTRIVDALVEKDQPDFILLCSSRSVVTSAPGSADYTSANAFQDAFANACFAEGRRNVIAVNWDAWSDVGMAARPSPEDTQSESWRKHVAGGIRAVEGVEAFRRVLGLQIPQILVITRSLSAAIQYQEQSLNTPRVKPVEPAAEASKPAPPSADLTESQQILAEIWQEMLGIPQIGIDDNFFELGGHSLLGTGILSRVRLTVNVALTLRALFEAPTIRQLSEIVDTMRWASTKPDEGVSSHDEEEREAIEI